MKKFIITVLVVAVIIGIVYYQMTPKIGSRSLGDFEKVQVGTSYSEIERQFGKPEKDIGSGLHIFVYKLPDQSEVWLGFAGLENLLYAKQRLSDGTTIDLAPKPSPIAVPPIGPITVRGVMVCLPHKNTEGPQTEECAFGLRSDSGQYFALNDTDPTYKNVSGAVMNVPVEVRGTFALRSGSNYQDVGVILVTKISLIK